MFETLRRDATRYGAGWYRHTGFWIVATYRFGAWAHALPAWFLRLPFRILYRLARLPFLFLNVDVWAGAEGAHIGPGLHLIHPHNIIIARDVEIGENCLIFHEVTLGTGTVPGRPKIGNNVDIYVGARILGGVTIGDGCMIGANSVVTTDVPPNSVVVAPPSRILPKALSAKARSVKPTAIEESKLDKQQDASP